MDRLTFMTYSVFQTTLEASEVATIQPMLRIGEKTNGTTMMTAPARMPLPSS